jgi:hypothetical protein
MRNSIRVKALLDNGFCVTDTNSQMSIPLYLQAI